MATAVIMPRQGQSVESCVIGEWFKKVGDDVGEGELLFYPHFRASASVGAQ